MNQEGVVWLSKEQTKSAIEYFKREVSYEKNKIQMSNIIQVGLDLVPKYLQSLCRDTDQDFKNAVTLISENPQDAT